MNKRIAITGMGIISSIGNNIKENLYALLNYKKGIAPIVGIATRHKNDIKVGEVLLSNKELANHLKLPNRNTY